MTDTTKRDAAENWKTKVLRQEVDRLYATVERQERILAALREPSENIRAVAFDAFEVYDNMFSAIRAAVAAAEQEVDRGCHIPHTIGSGAK